MRTRKSEQEEEPCATPGCWKMAGENGGSRGFCGACYSGWRRLLELDVAEVAQRLLRYRRLTNRVGFAQQQGALAAGAAPVVRQIQAVSPTSQKAIAFGRKYDRPGPSKHAPHGPQGTHLKAAS
jgi:hypothetical protein